MDRSGHRTIKPPDQAKSRLNGPENLSLSSYIACVQIQPPKVVSHISGGTSNGLYLYSGDLNEVTVSICLISERSLLIGSCQIEYRQLRSMHSNGDSEDEENKAHDLGGKRVLVSETFAYFGSE